MRASLDLKKSRSNADKINYIYINLQNIKIILLKRFLKNTYKWYTLN